MPAAWKNSAISLESGAPPETAKRSRPPRAAWSFENTSLWARRYLNARPAGTGFRACFRRDTSRPTPTAQWKIFFLIGEPASALAMTPA